MFDELAQQYFGSADEFAAALKLLQKCKTAEQNAASFEEFETTCPWRIAIFHYDSTS
ncbi:MAG: hypothetical protein ACR2PH_02515 [Desulfobulbia bacterium]